MKNLIADTNLFIRYFLNDIPEQAELAKKYFEQAKSGKVNLIICQIVIFEITFILRRVYNFDKDKIINHLGSIILEPGFEVEDRTIFSEALNIYKKTNISLTDSFLWAKAMYLKGEVVSFDKDYGKIK